MPFALCALRKNTGHPLGAIVVRKSLWGLACFLPPRRSFADSPIFRLVGPENDRWLGEPNGPPSQKSSQYEGQNNDTCKYTLLPRDSIWFSSTPHGPILFTALGAGYKFKFMKDAYAKALAAEELLGIAD